MRGALDLLQFLLWAEGFLCLLGVPALARLAWINGTAPWLDRELLYGICVAAAAPFVGWGILRREPWAWQAGVVHGLLQLPALPFLTPLGALELIALAHPDVRKHLSAAILRAPRRQPRWLKGAVYAIGFGWIGLCGFGSLRFLNAHNLPVWPIRHLVIVIPLAVFLDIAIHELGHLAAGWMVGFRFSRICVGPLLLCRMNDGWGVSLHPALTWDGGFTAALPSHARRVRFSLLLFVAGGPVASLVLALGCAMAFVSSPGSPWAAWAMPIGLLGAWAAFTFAANSAPLRLNGAASDGAWLVELAQGAPAGKRHCALYAMAASEHSPVRPADWHRHWVDQALAPSGSSVDRVAALVMAYTHHLDRNELKPASAHLREAVILQRDLPPSPISRRLWLERTYFAAYHERDALQSREAWSRSREGLPVEMSVLLRAECALLAVEGDTRCAAERLATAQSLLEGRSASGISQFEADRLGELAAFAQQVTLT